MHVASLDRSVWLFSVSDALHPIAHVVRSENITTGIRGSYHLLVADVKIKLRQKIRLQTHWLGKTLSEPTHR